MTTVVDIVLFTLLGAAGLALLKVRNLFAVVMLAGIYSLLSAGLFTVMDAVDVAFTEAAVGAGISTVLFLGALALAGHHENRPGHTPLLPLIVVVVTGGVLVYGTMDMPGFGHPDNPVHHHVADHYLEESYDEIGIPNVVTSVLASYRGYDTMGETTVVFAAAVGVMLLLSGARRARSRAAPGEGDGQWGRRSSSAWARISSPPSLSCSRSTCTSTATTVRGEASRPA